MQKKPPEPPKKPDAKAADAGVRRNDGPKINAQQGRDDDKAHRHRFSDGEKTTIMPLSEILKARDAARGSTPSSPTVDQFPEFSYQPTVKVAIPAELLKKKQLEAQKEAAAKEAAAKEKKAREASAPKAPEPQRTEPVAPRKTGSSAPPPGGQTPQHITQTKLVVSGEYTLKESPPQSPPPQSPPRSTPPADLKKTTETILPTVSTQEIKTPEARFATIELKLSPDGKPMPAPRSPIESKFPVEAKPAAPKVDEPLPAIAEPMTPPTVPSAPSNTNQVIVFFSCKGGSGATALSTNVAHHCATSKKRTVLVDLDLQLGDALAALSLEPGLTMAKAMEEAQKGGAMNTLPLPRHATGVSVLSQVGSLDDLDKISSEGISRFVEGLRATFDTIIVDGVRDFSDNVLAVLDMADKIAIVTVQEVLAIKRSRWAFGILRKIGFDGRDITVVVNRYANDEMIPFPTLKQMFDPAPVLVVPADGPLVLQSLNRGAPLLELSPQHTVTRNIVRLAKNLLGEQVEEDVEATVVAKSSFWDRLRPGKRE